MIRVRLIYAAWLAPPPSKSHVAFLPRLPPNSPIRELLWDCQQYINAHSLPSNSPAISGFEASAIIRALLGNTVGGPNCSEGPILP